MDPCRCGGLWGSVPLASSIHTHVPHFEHLSNVPSATTQKYRAWPLVVKRLNGGWTMSAKHRCPNRSWLKTRRVHYFKSMNILSPSTLNRSVLNARHRFSWTRAAIGFSENLCLSLSDPCSNEVLGRRLCHVGDKLNTLYIWQQQYFSNYSLMKEDTSTRCLCIHENTAHFVKERQDLWIERATGIL